MKVKCIENDGWKDLLTIYKTYEVIDEDKYDYKIICDHDFDIWYDKIYFKPLAEMRNETINKLLEDES